MMPFIKSSEFLCGNTRGEYGVGSERRKREREKNNNRLMELEKVR
jgi:hypothetical protein